MLKSFVLENSIKREAFILKIIKKFQNIFTNLVKNKLNFIRRIENGR